MTIGIFINKDHKNYIPYIAFLTAQLAEYENVYVHTFNNLSQFYSYPIYDKNIFLNRYCLLDLNFLSKKITNKNYILDIEHNFHIPICILNKKTIKNIDSNSRIYSFLSKPYRFKYFLLNSSCFSCYNDLDDSYIECLKEFYYKNKPIFYENKIYFIDPKNKLKKYKDTDIAILSKNLTVKWDKNKHKWIKLKLKEIK